MSDGEFEDLDLPEPPARPLDEMDRFDQAGIDALFGDVPTEQAKRSGLRAVLESRIVSHERLPMLEVVCERMVRSFSTSMRNLTSDAIDVSLEDITSVRFGDFMGRVELPAMLAVTRIAEWQNFGIMTVESSLIYAVVDALLGGRRGTGTMMIDGRDFTTIETNLVSKMIELALQEFALAFEPVEPITLSLERIETNPRFAAIARPSNVAAVATFRVDIDGRGGRFNLLFPYATLEPVRGKLIQRFMGEQLGRENIWQAHMESELSKAEVALDVVLGQRTLRLDEVRSLDVGQTIRLDSLPDDPLEIQCGGVPLAMGQVGQRRNNIAVSLVTGIAARKKS
jgi:flagellar motor switch protein FliM